MSLIHNGKSLGPLKPQTAETQAKLFGQNSALAQVRWSPLASVGLHPLLLWVQQPPIFHVTVENLLLEFQRLVQITFKQPKECSAITKNTGHKPEAHAANAHGFHWDIHPKCSLSEFHFDRGLALHRGHWGQGVKGTGLHRGKWGRVWVGRVCRRVIEGRAWRGGGCVRATASEFRNAVTVEMLFILHIEIMKLVSVSFVLKCKGWFCHKWRCEFKTVGLPRVN